MLLNIIFYLKYSKGIDKAGAIICIFVWVSGVGCEKSEEELKVTLVVSKTVNEQAPALLAFSCLQKDQFGSVTYGNGKL